MSKKHYDDILSDVTQPSLKRTQLPQTASSTTPVKSLHFVDDFDTGPMTSSYHTGVKDQVGVLEILLM